MSKTKKTKNLFFINFALGMAGKIHLNKVNKAARNCKKASEKTLRGILAQKDIVRHKLVTRIVNAYDAYDKEKELKNQNKQ